MSITLKIPDDDEDNFGNIAVSKYAASAITEGCDPQLDGAFIRLEQGRDTIIIPKVFVLNFIDVLREVMAGGFDD